MNDISLSQVDLIREVFHYQSRFAGSTIVFKIEYPITEDPGFPGLVKDLALLAKTGFKVVIVPGAKENIDAVLKQQNIASTYATTTDFPVRVTTSQAIPFVEMAAFDVASRFMTFLSGSRVEAVIGNFVRARGLGVKNGVDTEHTGTVDKIYADSLNKVLNLGMVPILPCIGWSPSGKPYNVQSDEIALAVSTALKAVKLFIVSVNDGLRADFLPEKPKTRPDGRLDRLTTREAEAVIAAGNGYKGQNEAETVSLQRYLRELKLALLASKAGVHRVHIVDGRQAGSVLKELFSNLGAGTMIYADEYDSIRALHSRDLPDILRLMEPLMQNGILIRRSADQILERKGDYSVFEIDGSVRACGALHDWGEAQGEIAAVATDPQYADMGLGRRIVGFLVEKARKAKMRRVFALTTQTQDWFESLGFKEAPVEALPEQKRTAYDQNRKSKVFALEL
ncbi:MAG: amino-acid N-acetyltransferase [Treponema sp.]|jgi:amino-acid N-acetyltransferase|nr:amino-acid N-acetyltransferase [Treponema sp.]